MSGSLSFLAMITALPFRMDSGQLVVPTVTTLKTESGGADGMSVVISALPHFFPAFHFEITESYCQSLSTVLSKCRARRKIILLVQ